MFMGTHINKVDQKRRVSVPLEFRNELAKEDCQALICFPSITGGCMEGGGPSYLQTLRAMIEAIDPYEDARQALEHATLGSCLQLPIDKDGRVTITQKFSQHARIDDQVAFVGLGERFEIWSPDALQQRDDEIRKLAFEKRGLLRAVNRSAARAVNGPGAAAGEGAGQ